MAIFCESALLSWLLGCMVTGAVMLISLLSPDGVVLLPKI